MLLEMKEITKEFPGVKALDAVSLSLDRGEILAIVGENGAGKSTLIKILSGAYKQDSGETLVNGGKLSNETPGSAIQSGISVIYQELNNVDQLTIAENIFLGCLPRRPKSKLIDYGVLNQNAKKLLTEVGLDVDPFLTLEHLSIAQKQLVEIAKALSKDMRILVMDEPTASLNNKEIETMFGIIRRLAERGIGILYISHRMEEIFKISNRVMVMRDGKNVAVHKTADVTPQRLIAQMVGREITDMYPARNHKAEGLCFEVKGMCAGRLKDISFSIQRGEIVGLFGLMGSGRTEIARAIFGANKRSAGNLYLNGREVSPQSPQEAKKLGIAYIPADRKKDGLMLIHSVSTNMTISIQEKIKKYKLLNRKLEKETVSRWISKLAIKTPSMQTMINLLSGGNQQKVVLAKWLSIEPKLLILNEPTRGIDVGSKTEIYHLMNDLCKQGIGILMISSDLPEVMGMSDRIITICDGAVSRNMEKAAFSQEAIMAGAIEQKEKNHYGKQ